MASTSNKFVLDGQIIFWNPAKAYGFIALGLHQYFFHASHFEAGYLPVVGKRVQFQLAPGINGKRTQCVNVRYPLDVIAEGGVGAGVIE